MGGHRSAEQPLGPQGEQDPYQTGGVGVSGSRSDPAQPGARGFAPLLRKAAAVFVSPRCCTQCDALRKQGSARWEGGAHQSTGGSRLFMHGEGGGRGSVEQLRPPCSCTSGTSGSSPWLRTGPCRPVARGRCSARKMLAATQGVAVCSRCGFSSFGAPFAPPQIQPGDALRQVGPAELPPSHAGGTSQELKLPHFLRKPGWNTRDINQTPKWPSSHQGPAASQGVSEWAGCPRRAWARCLPLSLGPIFAALTIELQNKNVLWGPLHHFLPSRFPN